MKFKIDITDTVVETATVQVEAENEEEAESLARQMIRDGTAKFERGGIEARDFDIYPA